MFADGLASCPLRRNGKSKNHQNDIYRGPIGRSVIVHEDRPSMIYVRAKNAPSRVRLHDISIPVHLKRYVPKTAIGVRFSTIFEKNLIKLKRGRLVIVNNTLLFVLVKPTPDRFVFLFYTDVFFTSIFPIRPTLLLIHSHVLEFTRIRTRTFEDRRNTDGPCTKPCSTIYRNPRDVFYALVRRAG